MSDIYVDPHFRGAYVVAVAPISKRGVSPAVLVQVPSLVSRVINVTAAQLKPIGFALPDGYARNITNAAFQAYNRHLLVAN